MIQADHMTYFVGYHISYVHRSYIVARLSVDAEGEVDAVQFHVKRDDFASVFVEYIACDRDGARVVPPTGLLKQNDVDVGVGVVYIVPKHTTCGCSIVFEADAGAGRNRPCAERCADGIKHVACPEPWRKLWVDPEADVVSSPMQ